MWCLPEGTEGGYWEFGSSGVIGGTQLSFLIPLALGDAPGPCYAPRG